MDPQYQFGNVKINGEEHHTLRVKSSEAVDLEIGVYHSIVEKGAEMVVSHEFKISQLLKRDTDPEGNNYVWYVLSEHVKTIDRFPAAAAATAQNTANIDYLSMMADIDLPNTTAIKKGGLFSDRA